MPAIVRDYERKYYLINLENIKQEVSRNRDKLGSENDKIGIITARNEEPITRNKELTTKNEDSQLKMRTHN